MWCLLMLLFFKQESVFNSFKVFLLKRSFFRFNQMSFIRSFAAPSFIKYRLDKKILFKNLLQLKIRKLKRHRVFKNLRTFNKFLSKRLFFKGRLKWFRFIVRFFKRLILVKSYLYKTSNWLYFEHVNFFKKLKYFRLRRTKKFRY